MGSQNPPSTRVKVDPNVEDVPWVVEGVTAGFVGATALALFFLVIDVWRGQPLATPNALGSALFLGRVPATFASPEPVLVVGYTALHGMVFVSAGLVAGFELLTGGRVPGASATRRTALLCVLLFLFFELAFAGFARLLAPAAANILGAGPVALANLLAAASMAIFLRARGERLGVAPEPADDEAPRDQ
jgi:hypothetical protein